LGEVGEAKSGGPQSRRFSYPDFVFKIGRGYPERVLKKLKKSAAFME